MSKSHDLSLPMWGPYSKRFFGLSHVADPQHGHRFDLTVIPTLFRRTLAVPDALRNSQYLPWLAAPDLKYYSYRQQLIWKDQVYVDIAFIELSDQVRLIRCDCVNHSAQVRNLGIHLAMAMELNPQEQVEVNLPEDSLWLNATVAGHVEYKTPRVRDGLNTDGSRRGERRTPLAVDGSCVGLDFGKEPGDSLKLTLPRPVRKNEELLLRYRADGPAVILWNGTKTNLPAQKDFSFLKLPVAEGQTELTLIADSEQSMDINGMALVPTGKIPTVIPRKGRRMPDFRPGKEKNSTLIRYEGIKPNYGLWWNFDSDFIRHYAVDDFSQTLAYSDAVHQHFLGSNLRNECKDNFLDVVLQPIPLNPGTHRVIHAIVASGSEDEISDRLAAVDKTPEALESAYQAGISHCVTTAETPWQFSQERMAAVLLTNVVYPIHLQNQYIRHHTPGRRWNCLYTWDSGFIGLGFLEFDRQRAEESLNTYLTEPGNEENAFIHHGSPVPVQIYLFHELWNRTGDDSLVRRFYPSLKQYYDFMVGRNPRSVTRKRSKTAMLCTWDYFYNSGGWDDYPPQWKVHVSKALNVLPVVPTAHMIRSAKMLHFAAEFLHLQEDLRQFETDIEDMTRDLQKVAWDQEAGVFSYVVHDDEGNPTGFFRAEDGSNYNQGLDGLSPLLADAVTDEQRKLFWNRLADPKHFWSPAGLSTVDRSASYYRTDGYWNGSVWMPYIYFFWKAALNDGQGDFAWQMARTAMDIWERETSDSYACYEQFNAENGCGQGWHHFSALSSPVVIFHGAYTAPERLTCGNDWHCRNVRFSKTGMTAELSSCGTPGKTSVMLVTLPDDTEYRATVNGLPAEITRRRPGCFELSIQHQKKAELTIMDRQETGHVRGTVHTV